MAFGTIDLKLRPIKIAFLVHPSDGDGLLEAIKINTFLWGGMYNPIIPTFQHIPKVWDDRRFKGTNSKKILSGYLDTYDPDYVVQVGQYVRQDLDIGERRKLPISEILRDVEKDGMPTFGTGLFEILHYFIDKELKFKRHHALDICIPSLGKRFHLFLASIFGSLPAQINKIFENNYLASLHAKKCSCSISNYADFLSLRKIFLRRLTSFYLHPIRNRSWGGQCVFFLDATRTLDIIDYWNLRAVGWNVIPIAKQASTTEKVKQLVLDFITANFDPKNYRNTILLKSRCTSPKEFREFENSLNIQKSNKSKISMISIRDWYPRIWDEWAREKDDVECCVLDVQSVEHHVSDYQERITFKILKPEFDMGFSLHSLTRFANEVDLRCYGTVEMIAEVIPEAGVMIARAIDVIEFDKWRFSKKGMVYLSSYSDRTIHLTIPKAEDVFSEWLRSKKWLVNLSPSGRIAKQMVKRLGGIWGINILAKESVIKLLNKIPDGKVMNQQDFWGEISKIANEFKYPKDPKKTLQRFIDAQMFRLGFEIQCPICGQHSWYSIKDADYELQCSKCLERFQIPSHSPKELEWSYRTYGPFSLRYQAYGVYSVLLTLRFFSQCLRGAVTPIMSFTAEKDGNKMEVDLGIFFQQSLFNSVKTELIFAECKTYTEFDEKDIKRLVSWGAQFPGAVLVFATMREELTPEEKRLLLGVINKSRRDWRAYRPHNLIMILTSRELFSSLGPPYCWKGLGEPSETIVKNYRPEASLSDLCESTQQLYLGIEHRHSWLLKLMRKHKAKQKIKN